MYRVTRRVMGVTRRVGGNVGAIRVLTSQQRVLRYLQLGLVLRDERHVNRGLPGRGHLRHVAGETLVFFSNPPLLHPGPSPRVLAFAGDPRFDRRPDRLRARSTSASGRGFPKHSGAGTGRRSTLWGGRSLIGQKMDAKRSL